MFSQVCIGFFASKIRVISLTHTYHSVYITASECCGQCACLPDCGAWTWSPTTKICYPKTKGGWYRDARENIVSGVMVSEDKYHRQGRLVWEPTLTVGDHTLKSFGQEISTNAKADNKYVVRDPTCDSSNPVVRAMYEKVCRHDVVTSEPHILDFTSWHCLYCRDVGLQEAVVAVFCSLHGQMEKENLLEMLYD